MLGRQLRRRFGRPGAWAGVAVVILLVGIVTLITGIPYLLEGDAARRPPLEEHLTKLDLPPGVTFDSLEHVKLSQIVDGSTITADMEDGRTLLLHYYGVNTPARGDRCFRESVDRNTMLLQKDLYVLEGDRPEDGLNLLRYVFLEDGTSLDATLVAEGFATAQTQDGYYKDQLVALEQEARDAGRGCLWKK
jgi:endonuclease YncB( thermonuclease family)